MKRLSAALVAAAALVTVMGCQGTEGRLTTGTGSARMSGQVILTETVAQSSPQGIEVREVGTGVMARTDADGNFDLFGVNADSVLLSFRRASDGIEASLVTAPSTNMQIVLTKSTARKRGRGIGHPGREIEGIIKSVSTGSLVVDSSHGEVTVKLVEATVVRKGKTTLAVTDLKVGDRVHVKASVDATDGTLTAVEVKLQGASDDKGDDDNGGMTATANGKVTAIGANQLTVLTASGATKKVNVDANTVIKRKGQPFAFSEIKVGDKVEAMGTRVDDDTILAKKIETQSGDKKP